MEARAEFRQPRISKGLVAIVAVSITLGLGVMAGSVAKNLNGSATTTQTHSISVGKGGPALQSVRHGGAQTIEENAPISTAVGPDDRVSNVSKVGNSFLGPDAKDRNSKLAAPSAGLYMPERGFREN